MVSEGRFIIDPAERRRRQMIETHNAYLSWAMRHPDRIPRIPRRRVDQGGFRAILNRPGARAAVKAFWQRTLDVTLDKLT